MTTEAPPTAVPFTYTTFGSAYLAGLDMVLRTGTFVDGVTEPTSIGSRFGRAPRRTLEIVGYAAHILDPSGFVLVSPRRRARLSSSVGLWAWTLSGSDQLAPIEYYNHRAKDFSDDAVRLHGALGPRLGGSAATDPPLLRVAIERLRADPASRRAVVPLLLPGDLLVETRDVPCSIAVQFLVRDGRLEALTYMRSQSAALVLVYDIFVFGALQRHVAALLDLPLGNHHLFAGSYHVYEDEIGLVNEVVAADVSSVEMGPMMPSEAATREFLRFETEVRLASTANDPGAVRRLAMDNPTDGSFEWQAKTILAGYGLARLGRQAEARALADDLPQTLQGVMLEEWEG